MTFAKTPTFKFNHWIFLGLCLVCVFFGYLARFSIGWDSFENDKKKYLQQVLAKTKQEIETCKNFNKNFPNYLDNKSLLFSNLMTSSKHPYYLFRNKKIIFWSDNEGVPNYADIKKNNTQVGLVKVKNDIFISVVDSLCHQDQDFEIVSLISISKSNKLSAYHNSSLLNQEIFGSAKPEILFTPSKNKSENISDSDGKFLFSLMVNHVVPIVNTLNISLSYFFFALSILLFFLFVHSASQKYFSQGSRPFSEEKKLAIWVIAVLAIRAIVFLIDFPNVVYESDLFNPRFFALSQMIPSLGDLVLYLIALFMIVIKLKGFIEQKLQSQLNPEKRVLILLFVVAFNQLFFLFWEKAVNELGKSFYWNLDINAGIQMTELKAWAFICMFILSCVFLIQSSFLIKAATDIPKKKLLLIFISSFLVVLFLAIHFETDLISFGSYMLVLVTTIMLGHFFNNQKLHLSQFMIYTVMISNCALCNALLINDVTDEKSLIERKKYVNDVLSENDLYAEYLIHEASEKIKNDGLVRSRFLNPMSSLDLVENKIRKSYFPRYFDKYEIQIDIYDVIGDAKFKDNNISYHDLKRKYAKPQNRTEYRNLFLVKDLGGGTSTKKYINFIEIDKEGTIYGYIILTFNRKRIVPHSVFPTLLVDKKFERTKRKDNYNYALYVNDTLSFSHGNYFYPIILTSVFKKNLTEQLNEKELSYNGFDHYINQETSGTSVVVSMPQTGIYHIFSNYSFWFLTMLLAVAMFYGWQLYTKHEDFSLISKIQLYVSLGFFFPLFLVGASSFGVFSNIYQEELKKEFISLVERTATMLSNQDDIFEKKVPKETIHNSILEISRNIEVDVTVFNSRGHLIHSSEPLIFEKGVLSPYIYPKAYLSILESKKKSSIQNENIGKLKYFSAYAPVLSNKNGKLLGVVGIPFFESETELFSKVTPVFLSIINIFTFAFIVLTLFFFFLSKNLIYPIKLLKNRMLEVSLENNPKPIDWKSDDEIGTLVKSYNKMLVKLEESKKQLSLREKESAWREMAKQVAHEIKNPLTPMKLMVQYNLLKAQNEPEKTIDIFKSTSEIVLKQIDTLSDIATSFSSFANMPTPKMEVYDFAIVLQEVYGLHKASLKDAFITLQVDGENFMTLGDEKLMFRIVNNLLLNAIQSVENGKNPKVDISLRTFGEYFTVSIKDNGTGIPDEIKAKIFQPNFSTKYNGSGIGLAIAKNGVEFFGGKIWFETKMNEGSVFFIKLPLAKI